MPASQPLIDHDAIDALTDTECRGLLASATFGRVGVTSGGLPVIFPVRYAYAETDAGAVITFRTGAGTKLRAAESGDVLAFEVDAYDPESGQGWSVLVLGRAVVATASRPGDEALGADRAAPSVLDHVVELQAELITGRRLISRNVERHAN